MEFSTIISTSNSLPSGNIIDVMTETELPFKIRSRFNVRDSISNTKSYTSERFPLAPNSNPQRIALVKFKVACIRYASLIPSKMAIAFSLPLLARIY